MTTNICNIYKEAAINSFGAKPTTKKKKHKFVAKKPWFTHECKAARQEYRKAKRTYNRLRNTSTHEVLKVKEKSYKYTLKDSVTKHRT